MLLQDSPATAGARTPQEVMAKEGGLNGRGLFLGPVGMHLRLGSARRGIASRPKRVVFCICLIFSLSAARQGRPSTPPAVSLPSAPRQAIKVHDADVQAAATTARYRLFFFSSFQILPHGRPPFLPHSDARARCRRVRDSRAEAKSSGRPNFRPRWVPSTARPLGDSLSVPAPAPAHLQRPALNPLRSRGGVPK